MTEKEKMIAGKRYNPLDSELRSLGERARRLTREYNETLEDESDKRRVILNELLGTTTNEVFIESNFRCDYGFNIHAEGFLLINYNCVLLDACQISFGKNVFIGPNTCISTATHPILPSERMLASYGKPVKIGNDVWIGANCTILPGVIIGDGTVIGAGSVVTKNIPENVIAVGNPCKVLRGISENDSIFQKSDE